MTAIKLLGTTPAYQLNVCYEAAIESVGIIICDIGMEEKSEPKTTGIKTMKAIVLEGPRQFVLKELPIPKPGHGEVLVKIIAAPINPSDLAFLAGGYQSTKKLPTTPGF